MSKFDLTERDREIIFAYAQNNMNLAETARNGFFHRTTVDYHLGKIERKTGLDPKKFYDLVKLVSELEKGVEK